MALTRNDFTGDGTTTVYTPSFALGFLQQSDVYVSLDTDDYTTQLDYTWLNSTQIVLNTPVASGVGFNIRRVVDRNAPINDYEAGAILRESNLDASFLQALMILHEIEDGYITTSPPWVVETLRLNGILDMDGNRITNLGQPIDLTDAVRLIDVQGILEGDFLTVPSINESIVLTDGQTLVTFVDNTTIGADFHINGINVDSRRLNNNDIDASATTDTSITLFESYPEGTTVTLVKRTGTGEEVDGQIRREFVHNLPTLAAAIVNTKAVEGDTANLKERTTGNGGGAIWDYVLASTVTIDNERVFACTGNPLLAVELRDNSRLDNKDTELKDAVDALRENVTTIAERGESRPFTDLTAIVNTPITTNKANPAVADVPESTDAAPTHLATSADHLHRLRNTSTGATSVQVPASLGTFAVSPKWDIEPSTQYTISMHSAPLNFLFYQVTAQVQLFDAAGQWVANVTPTAVSYGERQATFTTTASAAKMSINLRNAVDFSNSNPMTTEAFEACVNSIMLNVGAEALPFAEYSDGVVNPTTDLFDPVVQGLISIDKQADFYYIRTPCQQSQDKDVVWRVLANHGENISVVNSRSGVVDFYGTRFIDRDSVETKAAFNQSTEVHNAGVDESCPIRYNEMFQAGGHGAIGYTANMIAHGKTSVDVGSIWSDGTDEWVLTYINSVDGVTFVRRNTGSIDKWVITSADFSSTALSHVSGATNTTTINMTSSSQYQIIPIIRDYLAEFRLDDVAISSDGAYKGNRLVLSETYSLMNIASQQAWLISDVGNPSPDYTNDAITEQVRFYYEYEWNEFGAMSIRAAHGAKEDYRRAALNGYWGALQLQRLSLTGDSSGGMHSKVFVYIPEVAPVSGLDFKNVAEVTSNLLDVNVLTTDCDDVSDPASHYSLIGKDGSDVTLSGHLFGYDRSLGLGIPTTRANSVGIIYNMSPNEKNYPHAIDYAAGDAVANTVDEVTAFRAPFLPTDTDLTVPAVLVSMNGKLYCYITSHKDLTNKLIAIPKAFNGLKVTTIKHNANVTVHSEFVSSGAITISVENNYGDVVLQLG